MRAAKDISEGKDVKLEPKPIHQSVQKRPPEHDPPLKRHCNGEDRKLSIDKLPNARIPKIPSGKPLFTSDSAKKPENRPHQSTSFPAKSSSSTTKPFHKPRDDMDVKKDRKDAHTTSSHSPAVPGKRYLPGDIRYKQAMEMQQSSGSANPIRDQPGSSKKMPHESQAFRVDSNKGKGGDMRKESTHNRTKIGSQIPGGEHRSSSIRSGESLKRYPTDSHRDRIRERDLSHHRKSYGHDRRSEHRHHSYTRAYDYDSFQEEDFEEDEYDSEMDDFIDDSGLDMEELSRQEFEETLKMVNPKYNKKKWRET
ncbi:hypothetical protein KIN20_035298 [Parelaphostrongylus tenuis]|uniref:Protein SPT2 homolog n=1 Tax=Parelaphostrongylus tenuis TaxID=148309 RepID=A0AAD5WKD9_PARTN|nr:hypothetical protein KIN20_035298 [Parelaphostrongylus tenuis]